MKNTGRLISRIATSAALLSWLLWAWLGRQPFEVTKTYSVSRWAILLLVAVSGTVTALIGAALVRKLQRDAGGAPMSFPAAYRASYVIAFAQSTWMIAASSNSHSGGMILVMMIAVCAVPLLYMGILTHESRIPLWNYFAVGFLLWALNTPTALVLASVSNTRLLVALCIGLPLAAALVPGINYKWSVLTALLFRPAQVDPDTQPFTCPHCRGRLNIDFESIPNTARARLDSGTIPESLLCGVFVCKSCGYRRKGDPLTNIKPAVVDHL